MPDLTSKSAGRTRWGQISKSESGAKIPVGTAQPKKTMTKSKADFLTYKDAAPDALIRDLEDQRYQAVLEQDFDRFESLCHERLVYSHSGGNRDSLDGYLRKLRSGDLRYHRIDHITENVLIVGGTALVLGQMAAQVTVKGQQKTLNNTFLAVWVNVDSTNWKLIAYQPTPRNTGA